MGTSVNCELPVRARIEPVAKVLAALIGHEKCHEPIHRSDATFSRVKGYSFDLESRHPDYAHIVLDCSIDTPAAKALAKWDGEKYHLHYGWGYSENGGISLHPASTPTEIALCAALVQFFGGRVDFNDADVIEWDLEVEPREDIRATNDPLWSQFENRILAIQPLTQEDIDKYQHRAAYSKKEI